MSTPTNLAPGNGALRFGPPPIVKPALKALLSWIPGLPEAFYDATAGGGTASASYCYGVWLKHLTLLWSHGMRTVPRRVIELGPGDSLGTGFAALLCGAERYVGIDRVAHADAERNVKVCSEIAALLRTRAPRPRAGWPDFDALLDDRLFPSHILTEAHLRGCLAGERLARLERAAATIGREPDAVIRYTNWAAGALPAAATADLVFSHAVLGLVEDLDAVLGHCARWLIPGGWMSHQIDMGICGVAAQWNGQLRYGDRTWRFLRGRRPFFANRERCSGYLRKLERHGFEVVAVLRKLRFDSVPREALAARYRDIPEDDLRCGNAFIIARKR